MSIENARRRKAQKAAALSTVHTLYGTLAEAVTEPQGALGSALLWHLLLAWPGVGPTKARRICEQADVWPLSRLDQLTSVERAVLRDILR